VVDESAERARRAEARRLADELRRILDRLAQVRPPADALARAAEVARGFADTLDALPARDPIGEVSEAGLMPRHFISYSPVSGQANAIAPPVTLRLVRENDDASHRIEGEVTFGAAYEGPPGHVHGGWIAATFDEALGFALLSPGFTASLTVTYRKPTPLHRPLRLSAWIESIDGRKRRLRGQCTLEDGTLLAEAEGLFIAPRDGDDYVERLRRSTEG
jgi:acyl-coenzyme A thioesterase PaaI-like protein